MDLSRQEYPGLLSALQPSQAVSVLNDRVKLITSINVSIADWLQERRKVEEQYVTGLQKLARRPQQDGGAALGVFQIPWQRIVKGTAALADSHQLLATKIEADVENPLRQFAVKNRDMQSMSTIQGNLASIAKDYDGAQKKAEKLQDSSNPDKVANATTGVDDARQQWESQAPYVFEQLQSLDETRCNHLRDLLTQFQTHEVDQVERNRTSAEECLNLLLNVETADEIKTFASKVGGGRSAAAAARRSSATGSARPLSSVGPPPTPPPPRQSEQRPSQSFASPSQDRLGSIDEKSSKKSAFGGIKRFGTVMGRRKSQLPDSTPEKRDKKSRFAFRRGDSSRSFQEVDEGPSTDQLTPAASRETRETVSRGTAEPAQSPRRQPESPQVNRSLDRPAETAMINGTTLFDAPYVETPSQPPIQTPQELSAAPLSQSASPIAYEQPPQFVDLISRAQQDAEAAESEDQLRKLNIRDQPIPEDEAAAQQAMSSMANQLRMQAQTSNPSRMTSVRGRRDVRNTMFVPNAVEPADATHTNNIGATAALSTGAAAAVAGAADLASPIKRAETPASIPEEPRTGSDVASVNSSNSMAGMVQHPEMHDPGLNASIVESVTTTFRDGQVESSYVTGEIALAYNSNSDFPASTETVRIENYNELLKSAPNPAFVTPTVSNKGKEPADSEDRTGEYTINLSVIRRPMPTTALKYQLLIDEANLSACSPVLLTPAWQIEDNQASVIVPYALNPAFAKASGSVTLKNVVISVSLDKSGDAGKPLNAMMMPTAGASFKRKAALVVWRMAELTVESEGEQKQLLARFLTSGGLPKAGSVEIRFEIPGTTASGLGVSTLAPEASDPFADERAAGSQTRSWNALQCAKKLVSGRYNVVN